MSFSDFFGRFRRKGETAAPVEPTVSTIHAVPATADAEPARHDKVPRIRNYDDIQPYQGVLTGPGNVLAIPEAHQKDIALLGLGASNAFLIATEHFYGSSHHMTLLARAKRIGVNVQVQLIAEDASVLALIYERDRRKSGNRDDDAISKADSVQLFELIIAEAVTERATDVHLIIREENSHVEFRIDGLVRRMKPYPSYMLNEAVGVAYNKMAEETSRSHPAYNVRLAQSCSVLIDNAAGRALNLRYQSIPVVGGTNIILRLLFTDDEHKESPTLEQLGYEESHQRQLTLAARKTVGAIVVSGVTNSGKSTTLKTLLTMSPDRHLWKQYSVEDPAEYKLPGVAQVSVQRTAEATAESASVNPFVAAMRVIMRGDPDEIMVGEVRDAESGSLLKTMVQSGHQVYTTIHAASALEIPDRLTSEEIGLSRQTLGSRNFVSAFVYQKLLAVNCKHCSLPAEEVLPVPYLEHIEKKFKISRATLKVAKEDGCPHCKGRGVFGQTVAAEIVIPDADICKLIREGRDMEAEDVWRSRRTAKFDEPDCEGKTAFEHALYKMSQGRIDPRIIEDSFEPFETYQVHQLASNKEG